MRVLGVDSGGTFTDVVAPGPGGLVTAKVPSTPDDPGRAVLDGLARVGGAAAGGRVHHGTTVATNTVLTRTGARVGLVTSRGFADLLHVGRGHRLDLFALAPARTAPLVARDDVVELDARGGPRGDGRRAPPAAALAGAVRRLRARGVEAVAVVLLHATTDGALEDRVAAACRALGVPVAVSHRVSADGREVERAETTVLDAYVAPRLASYVARLAAALPPGALSIARSDGTRMTAAETVASPVRTLLSGPAAGVAAVHALARRLGVARALGFDVGGTSTDVAWVEGPALSVTTDRTLDGFAMSVPSLDVHSVGAGGGSVVRLDAGGALVVGPASAGAVPGPACYGRGGPATLTDALLLLGRVPAALADGAVALDLGAARRALAPLARRAGLSLRALCEGAVRVAEASTARAVRTASAAAGRDPRGASLVAFGGAGGCLAAAVASHLGLAEVVVPWSPGTFAAQGARIAPRGVDRSEAVVAHGEAALAARARALAAQARAALEDGGERAASVHVEVDARYEGQGTELAVRHGPRWRAAFHAAHGLRRGFLDEGRAVEAVRLRARALSTGGALEAGADAEAARRGATLRPAARVAGLAGAVAHHRREELPVGVELRGPACVVEATGTTFVPVGAVLVRARDGTLRLRGRTS
ncbi:MAG: hydantoinase/oxoprolinase family protein [Planctomycetes bacterium]|nr:hydantoinase/oxoprolinase family protein [Planctomycetota bacterium]